MKNQPLPKTPLGDGYYRRFITFGQIVHNRTEQSKENALSIRGGKTKAGKAVMKL